MTFTNMSHTPATCDRFRPSSLIFATVARSTTSAACRPTRAAVVRTVTQKVSRALLRIDAIEQQFERWMRLTALQNLGAIEKHAALADLGFGRDDAAIEV